MVGIPQQIGGRFSLDMLAALGLNLMNERFHLTVYQFHEQTVRDSVIVYPRLLFEQSNECFQRAYVGIR
ncbi:hypothetical protein D3C71_1970290 [compost metagenome]